MRSRLYSCNVVKPTYNSLRKATCFFLAISFLLGAALALLLPEASYIYVYENGGAIVDASHTDQGYVMVKRQSGKVQKLRLSLGKSVMSYDLNSNGAFEMFPLQFGDGHYKLEIFEQISGKKYQPVSSVTFAVTIPDPNVIYLYPNQYVSYDSESQAIAKSVEICANATTPEQKVEAIYRYFMGVMSYDYVFAAEVGKGKHKGYLPSVDRTLITNTGVCFDFSALFACMLRAQGIPTQLVIGYADKTYHAWNNILVNGTWYQYDVTSSISQSQFKKYTPERVY